MAFNQRIAFEVDAATGNNGNGGGFDDTSGTPGTNYAWGANQLATAITDLTCAGAGSTFTSPTLSALAGGAASCVGNVIKVTGGANAVTGRFQILSQAAGTFTVDRAISTGAVSGGTGTLGGSLATIQEGLNAAFINAGAIADCRVYVKKGNYTGTAALTNAGGVGFTGMRSRIIGYNTTHDDNPLPGSGNQPSYAVTAAVNGIDSSKDGYSWEYLDLDGSTATGAKGFNCTSGNYNKILYCKIHNFSAEGINLAGTAAFAAFCEVTACAGTSATVVCNVVLNCWIHKNTKTGISLSASGIAVANLITNNSGASSDGINISSGPCVVVGNTIYGNGRDGIRTAANAYDANFGLNVYNNILAKNAGYGLNIVGTTPSPNTVYALDYNAFYSNNGGGTGLHYNHLTAGPHDVTVTSSPFVSNDTDLAAETTPNWGLNSTASAGASLRAVGFPGQMPGLSNSSGYRDIGLFQHHDSGGGTFIQPPRGLGGGLWRA